MSGPDYVKAVASKGRLERLADHAADKAKRAKAQGDLDGFTRWLRVRDERRAESHAIGLTLVAFHHIDTPKRKETLMAWL